MSTIETAAKAAVAELKPSLPAAGTAERNLIDATKKDITAENHPLKVLAEQKAPGKQAMLELVNANTGTNYDPVTGRKDRTPGTPEATRYTEAENLVNIFDKLQRGSEADIDTLASADTTVINSIEGILFQNATLKAEYQGASAADKKKIRASLLRDPSTRARLDQLLAERISSSRLLTDEVSKVRGEKEALEDKKTKLSAKETALNTTIGSTQTELEAYQTQTAGGVITEGAFVTKLAQLQKEAQPIEKVVEQLDGEIQNLDARIKAAEQHKLNIVAKEDIGKTAVAAAITKLEADMTVLQNERKTKATKRETQGKLLAEKQQEIKGITERKAHLEATLASSKTDLADVQKQLAETNPQLAAKIAELQVALSKRDLQESEFVASLSSVLTESVGTTVNDRLDKLVKKQLDIEKQDKDKAKTEADKKARAVVQDIAYDTARNKMDWKKFDTEWKQYMAQGADAYIDAQLSASTMSAAEIAALKADKEAYGAFVTDAKTKMARLRMARPTSGLIETKIFGKDVSLLKLRKGPEQFNQAEIDSLMRTFDQDYFNQMIKDKKISDDAMKAAEAQGLIDKGGIAGLADRLKKMPGLQIVVLLGILLGGSILAAV